MCSRKLWIRLCGMLLAIMFSITLVLAVEGEDTEDSTASMSAAALHSGLLEANSNRQVHPFSSEPVESQFTTEGFEQVCRNDALTVYLNRDEGAVRIRNNATGYLWGALPLGEAEGLNSTWRCYGNSLVAMECFSEDGTESRFSIGKDGNASYEMCDDGFICTASFPKVGVSLQVQLQLHDNAVTMALVDGTLQEGLDGSTYTLKSLVFMPFFGSSYSDNINGYILIPDGCGGLIRYRQPANYSSTYASRIYGKDLGIETKATSSRSTAKQEPQVLVPIFGMVHGAYQNGFLAVVEDGAEYASIIATPAQTNNPYNWSTARFELRQKYVKNINRKDGAGTNVPQEMINPVTPKISFYFTDGEQANYDGMAVMYRDMLIDQGVLTPTVSEKKDIPLLVEFLGADKKENFLWNTTEVFTTASEAAQIIDQLSLDGINNVDAVYRCYTKNNEAGAKRLRALGQQEEFEQLETVLKTNGGQLFYYLNPTTANEDQITLRTEAANTLSNMEISWTDVNAANMYPKTYLYRLKETEKRIKKTMGLEYADAFAVDKMSNTLYGDFTSGKEIDRAASLQEVHGLVQNLAQTHSLALYQPNQYLWQYTEKMFNLPSTNSQLLYESDSVPFLQIVLSGCQELFSSTINTSSYSKERLLRQIEYGMAPSFTVTGCPSIDLYGTAQEMYFSTNYNDWQTQITETYHFINDALAQTWGHAIISHRCIETGLVCVTYDNGIRIYINYTDQAKQADGIKIEPCDFSLVRR